MLTALDNTEIDAHALRVIPDGSDAPPLPIPDTIEYTPEDLERMARDWDKFVPQAAGALTAPVVGGENAR